MTSVLKDTELEEMLAFGGEGDPSDLKGMFRDKGPHTDEANLLLKSV